MMKKWSQQEIQYLKENWGRKSLLQIMEELDRTEDSVMRKARRIGLNVNKPEEEMLKRKWTGEEDDFIIKNYGILRTDEISQQLGRTVNAVRKRALALGVGDKMRRWSADEMEFLNENWGILNVDVIAKRLNRSRNSILLKAHQMLLRQQVAANGAYLTPSDISSILGINIRTLYSWIWNGSIGHRKFKVGKKRKYQIAIEDFCEFIEKHQDKWDSQKADIMQIKSYYTSYFITKKNNLTIKRDIPQWMIEKIERDKKGFREYLRPWTTKEELKLLQMAEQKHTFKEICTMLDRSIDSVKAKLYLLHKQKNGTEYKYEENNVN